MTEKHEQLFNVEGLDGKVFGQYSDIKFAINSAWQWCSPGYPVNVVCILDNWKPGQSFSVEYTATLDN